MTGMAVVPRNRNQDVVHSKFTTLQARPWGAVSGPVLHPGAFLSLPAHGYGWGFYSQYWELEFL